MKVSPSCLTLCNPMDYTDHGILQARILEWIAFPFSRGSSQPRDQTQVSCIADGFFTCWATREAIIPFCWKFGSRRCLPQQRPWGGWGAFLPQGAAIVQPTGAGSTPGVPHCPQLLCDLLTLQVFWGLWTGSSRLPKEEFSDFFNSIFKHCGYKKD